MDRITAKDLVDFISALDTKRVYKYVSGKSHLEIISIQKPEGPIVFRSLKKDGTWGKQRGISKQQLNKLARLFSNKPNYPFHIDRVFSAGGNSRSALETLLANTPHFFICYPERTDLYTGKTIQNLKHIMWCPNETHEWNKIEVKAYRQEIREIEIEVNFEQIHLSQDTQNIPAKTIHTQMQVALIEIGRAMKLKTWIAKNDQSIQVGNKKLGELDGVVKSLEDVAIFYKPEIIRCTPLSRQ